MTAATSISTAASVAESAVPAYPHCLIASTDPEGVLRTAGALATLDFRVGVVALPSDPVTLRRRASFADVVVIHSTLVGDGASDDVRRLGELVASVRRAAAHAAIVALVAASEEMVLAALQAGADDCVAASASVQTLAARMTVALLRRGGGPTNDRPDGRSAVLRFADVECDLDRGVVYRADHEVPLTRREFALLVAVASRRGGIATIAELRADVWGITGSSDSRVVAQTMSTLRQKLEDDPARPQLIRTVHGRGYRLVVPSGVTRPARAGGR